MEHIVRNAVSEAIESLLLNDSFLLEIDASERAICHRLAVYLESYFSNWNVDCEYNRNSIDVKRLNIESRTRNSTERYPAVFPDIIVHLRNTEQNLLVIEMKKTTSQEDDSHDYRKLNAFKSELGYQFAVFIKVKTDGQTGIEECKWI